MRKNVREGRFWERNSSFVLGQCNMAQWLKKKKKKKQICLPMQGTQEIQVQPPGQEYLLW